MKSVLTATRAGLLFALCWGCSAQSVSADLVAYWSFNSYDGNAASIAADSGSGSLEIVGFPAGDLDAVTGTTLNAVSPFPAGTALQLSNVANQSDWIDITVNLSTFVDPIVTFATFRNSSGQSPNQGFDSNTLEYSLDSGTNFTAIATEISPQDNSFALEQFDLSAHDLLDNAAEIIFRYTFDGGDTGTNRNTIDNLQINATFAAIPEASSLLFGAIVLSGGGVVYLGKRYSSARRI